MLDLHFPVHFSKTEFNGEQISFSPTIPFIYFKSPIFILPPW